MKNKLIVGINCHQSNIENIVAGMIYYIFNKRTYSNYNDFMDNRHQYKVVAINHTISYENNLRNIICSILGLNKEIYLDNLTYNSFYSIREQIYYIDEEFITPEHKIFTKEDNYVSLIECSDGLPIIRLKDLECIFDKHLKEGFGNTYNVNSVQNIVKDAIKFNDISIVKGVDDIFKKMSLRHLQTENIISLNIEIGKENDTFTKSLVNSKILYSDGNYMKIFYALYTFLTEKLCTL